MRIKNWQKHQHFKDRRPPWIKLHRELLDQRDINEISDGAFRLLIFLWLLAAEDEDKVGNLPSINDISFRLRMDEKKITKLIQELGEWIDYSDIKLISKQRQPVPPETEEEAYKEETEAENLCERDFIISQHKRIFARPITPTEFGKFGYLMQFPEAKIEKAFTLAKGKKSLNYVISVLENDKPDKPKKEMLRK